jgi:hypothetical protein
MTDASYSLARRDIFFGSPRAVGELAICFTLEISERTDVRPKFQNTIVRELAIFDGPESAKSWPRSANDRMSGIFINSWSASFERLEIVGLICHNLPADEALHSSSVPIAEKSSPAQTIQS